MKEPNEIDLLFQHGLDGLTFTPDPYVKENIDHAIASKKKRRRFLFILFPVLLGLTGFAAVGLFYQHESQNEHKIQSQNETRRSSVETDLYKASDHPSMNTPDLRLPKKNAEITRNNTQTTHSSNRARFYSYRLSTDADQSIPSQNPTTIETGFEPEREKIQAGSTSEKPAAKIPGEDKTPELAENKPDSTVAPLPDSASLAVSEVLKHMGSSKGAGKWSLSVLTYWEGEKRKKNDFNDVPFIDGQRETARIHASTFYAKIEAGYQLNSDLEILSGIGFRTSRMVQYGYLNKIEYPLEGVSSGVPQPDPEIPDTIHRSEKQEFTVNAVVLPIGLAYTLPITTRLSLRLSGGGEFAYGKITSRFIHPDLSAPKFNSFGCSVWLRPEIHYSFGRAQLFGFGTFNQSLSQQLRWNVDTRRNPAFGAGIGLRIRL